MKGQRTKFGVLEGSSICIMKYKSIYMRNELAKNKDGHCTGGTNAGAELSKHIHLHLCRYQVVRELNLNRVCFCQDSRGAKMWQGSQERLLANNHTLKYGV